MPPSRFRLQSDSSPSILTTEKAISPDYTPSAASILDRAALILLWYLWGGTPPQDSSFSDESPSQVKSPRRRR